MGAAGGAMRYVKLYPDWQFYPVWTSLWHVSLDSWFSRQKFGRRAGTGWSVHADVTILIFLIDINYSTFYVSYWLMVGLYLTLFHHV
jgi:hypothetical protein